MAAPDVEFLTIDDLYRFAEHFNGNPDSVADHGLLAAAVARPQASVFGEDAYPTLSAKAAALLHSLITNHALVDGNKRTGMAAMLSFYAINGVRLTATQDELFHLAVAVADGTLRDVPKIAERLASWELPRRHGEGSHSG